MKKPNCKYLPGRNRFNNSNCYFVLLLFFVVLQFSNYSIAQPCSTCLTNTIRINTGYNPITNSKIAEPSGNGISVLDPYWRVAGFSPAVPPSVAVSGPGGTPWTLAVPPFGSAYVVYTGGTGTDATSSWISGLNAGLYRTFLGGPTGPEYWIDLARDVQLCRATDLTLSFQFGCDNWVEIYFDGTLVYSVPLTGAWTPAYVPVTPITAFIPGAAVGTHTLRVRLHNFNHPTTFDWNPSYFVLRGTITAPVAALARENNPACLPVGCHPPIITGAHTVCVGATVTLTPSTAGGTWLSDAPGTAAVSATGVVTGVSAGVATITYTDPCGIIGTHTVTVNATPAAIAGSATVCVGSTIALADPTAGGTWSTASTHAGVGLTTGIVTGITAGTATISYTVGGCFVTKIITVNASPSAITGSLSICSGSLGILASSPSGGIWTTSDPSVINIIGPGVVQGGTVAGTAVVMYTLPGGCFKAVTMTNNPLPGVITGLLSVCIGFTTPLASTPSGGTWSSSNTAVATVSGSGIVSGIALGTANITYALATGCIRTAMVNVIIKPDTITGPGSVCPGSSITLSSAPPGGSWSSSAPGVATIVAATGVLTGVSPGTTTITYSLGGCVSTRVISVNPTPTIIGGSLVICEFATSTLTNGTAGGTWSSSNTAVATIGLLTGVVTGITSGTSTITYTSATDCFTTAVVTVNISPTAIIGGPELCVGTTLTLSGLVAGGTWWSSNTAVATIGISSGVVTGVTAGTTLISYTLPDGCLITKVITVDPIPAAITGTLSVCQGLTTSLSSSSSGGTWTSSDASVATVNLSTGVVTGVAPVTATISYHLLTCIITAVVTVNPLPPAITGITTICLGSSATLSDATAGGSWTSGNTAIATIGASSGIVSGIGTGTSVITYMLPTGCFITTVVTVAPALASITGTLHACVGQTTALANTTAGGTWSSSDGAIATVGPSTGLVTGVSSGTVTISYGFGGSCFVTAVVTIVPMPGTITGPSVVCVGATIALGNIVAGGTWTSGSTGIATVIPGTGVVTGVAAGTAIITYAFSADCYTTKTITVNPIPAAITGIKRICAGNTTTLGDATGSGTWSSSNTIVATVVSGTGVVTGVSGGTSVLSYILSTGCYVTTVVTIDPLPAAISGSSSVCIGFTITLTDATSGGTWSSSNTSAATIGISSGIVTGIAVGTTVISYMLSTGCYVTKTITVNSLPGAITGSLLICEDSTTTLTDTPALGFWFSDNPLVASIGFASGIVTGNSGGTAHITYTIGSGCYVAVVVTVLPLPVVAPIICADTICKHTSVPISDASAGGVWSVSDPGIVTVPILVGGSYVIGGLAVGTATVSYTVTNACGSTIVTKTIVVADTPVVAPIAGVLGVCSGYTDTLHDATPGGKWYSSTPSIATIDSFTGVVTGITGGTVTITYRVTTICGTAFVTTNVLVNMAPYITTDFIVACQTLASNSTLEGATHPVISDNECILVCDSSIVRYYANGVAGSAFTWNVAGGTVVADYGDSIDVFWTTVGLTGTIVLQDTFHHCIDSASACVKVIAKPHAYFTSLTDDYCLGDDVFFYDFSTSDPSSPIVYYHWDFGDGQASSTIGTAHHIYTAAGTYNVTLTVRNQCNCVDHFTMKVSIEKTPGPQIQCPSVVCDSEYAAYSTSATCGTYNWTIVGGNLVAGSGSNSILVHWNYVDSTGFGYVTLETPGCMDCNSPTTIKVPVILQSPKMTGKDTICAGSEFEFSLPLWPATDYMWGVLGEPGAVAGCRDDHTVVLNFATAGTYTVHGWYQNRIKRCGADVFKTITVVPPSTILGENKICVNATYTYSVTGGYTADWVLTDFLNNPLTTGSGTTFTTSFSDPGTYLLHANGGFCAEPLTITVKPLPYDVDSVKGKDTVCLNRVYSYQAFHNIAGNVFAWEAVGGYLTPSSGTDMVTVVWTSSGTKQLKVWRESQTPPYCAGAVTVIDIIQEVINPHVTGYVSPCANTYYNYTCNYTRGEVYDWAIYPNTAGSILEGNHDPVIRVLWNNTDTIVAASLVVTVRKCDSTILDTLHLTVGEAPPMAITVAPDTVCPGTEVSFSATFGGGGYHWLFGDGTGDTVSGNSVYHIYPANHSGVNHIYHASVEGVPGVGACPSLGIATHDIVVKPRPSVHVVRLDTFNCVPDTSWLHAIATLNAGAVTYQWYGGHPGTGPYYNMYDTGGYYCVVTAADGCVDTSNGFDFGLCGDPAHTPCTTTGTVTNACNVLTFTGAPGHVGYWYPYDSNWPVGHPPTNPFSVSFNQAGIYHYTFADATAHCVVTIPGYIYIWCRRSTMYGIAPQEVIMMLSCLIPHLICPT